MLSATTARPAHATRWGRRCTRAEATSTARTTREPELAARASTSQQRLPRVASGRTGAIWLLALSVSAAAAYLLLGTARQLPAPAHRLDLPWWALLGGFYVAECLVVHVHVRRATHTLSLGALPLVVGLFSASPAGVVGAQLLGTGTALAAYRRQAPVRVAFGLAQTAVRSTLAVIVFRAIAGGANPFGPIGWAAGLAAAGVAALTGVVLVTAAMSLAERRPPLDRGLITAGVSMLGTLTAGSLALVGVELADTRPEAVVLLFLPVAASALAMRAYASEHRRREHAQSLYDSIRATDGSEGLEAGVKQLLLSARRLLRAEYAELILLPATGRDRPMRSSIGPHGESPLADTELSTSERIVLAAAQSTGGPITRAKDRWPAALVPYRAERGLDDLIATTLDGERGPLGLLLVGDRHEELGAFGAEDEQLLRTFAGHAALLLENEQLEQSLAKLTKLEAKLRHQAQHDALTGLANRRLFEARVHRALERARAGDGDPVVLYFDLDGFKKINDDLGHAAGDELLVAFSERLRANVRPDELPARLGGDEFAVLIERGGEDVAVEVAQRLVAALRSPFSIEGRRLSVRLSIGIAAADGVEDVGELLANADRAMYRAKSDSAACYAVYSERMRGGARARERLVVALEEALERDRIAVHYQPIVDLDTGETAAFEALVRWRRSESETVVAADFLPAAEERELIHRIGRFVLRSACSQTQAWRSQLPGRDGLAVCVNLSAVEFRNPRLCAEVAAAVLDAGLDARRLVLEITEATAMEDVDAAQQTMSELRRLGVRLALDGFGSGRSALDQLCRLPFDTIKIARPLVERIGSSRRDDRVARAIVGMAGSLGLEVIAEGIESAEQALRLREAGCRFGQGFYFDRALAVAAARRRLESTERDRAHLYLAPS